MQEEDDFLDGSEFEGISESESEGDSGDDDWQPAGSRRKSDSSTRASAGSKKRAKKEQGTHVLYD